MPENFKYDVFLSHSSKDKGAVRELAKRLGSDGLRVWFDEWEIQPGDVIGLRIERGLEQSRTLVLVMSGNAFASEWVTLERHTVLFRDPTNAKRRFIPLRLDDAEINDALKQFAYVDWRPRSDEQYAKLLIACRPPPVSPEAPSEKASDASSSRVLEGHTSFVEYVAITANGQRAISGSADSSVKVWNLRSSKSVTLKGHTGSAWGVAITPDGQWGASGSSDRTVRVWNIKGGESRVVLRGHTDTVRGVAISGDGRRVVSGSVDTTVRLWNVDIGKCVDVFKGHSGTVYCVALSDRAQLAISGSYDKTVRVWNLETGHCLNSLAGHTKEVWGVALTPDGKTALSGSSDKTVRVWDVDTGRCLAALEGHTDRVFGVAVSADGRWAVSGSSDKTVRLWDLQTGRSLAILKGHGDTVYGVAMTPDGSRAVSVSGDKSVRTWRLTPYYVLSPRDSAATRYTNAKVLLVGDSGVGKSALAIRLTENRFEPATMSTDAMWASQLKLPHQLNAGDIDREIWLWDFAGQADYRLIHQLFMDETSLAVLVFNPQSENPFEGLGQWDRDLQRAARRSYRKLLVAGRCDRGRLMVSRGSLKDFCEERGFVEYLETSACTGEGSETLRNAIVQNIPWEDIPWTASPRIFKLLKEEIVKLKDESRALLRMGELKQQLEMRLSGESFTPEQLQAVVGLLAGPGIVWQLEFGDFILLQPERINAYAAAVIRKVRMHAEEIGVILEGDVLDGRLDYQDMKRLSRDEEQIVLRAMHQTFVDHGLCLREPTETGTLLVFPSYFKRERPEMEGHPAVFVTYNFNGQLDEIYSTLVVRLHHTPAFEKDQLWRFAADFKTLAGKRVGVKMTKHGEGSGSIAIYFEPKIADDMKVTFIRYVHEHLQARAQGVVRLRHYVCAQCNTPVENLKTAWDRLNRGLKDIVCVNCEQRVPLWDLIEQKFASVEFQQRVRELEEQARISIDNESRELILIGHAFAIAGEAGQIFRPTPNSDWGIDGEIEFKNDKGEASGARVYLQLKSGDSYLQKRRGDGKEVFTIKNRRHIRYWQSHAYPVMLVIRTSDGEIRWMNMTEYLQREQAGIKQIVFDGEPLTALSVVRLRDRLLSSN